MLSFVVFDRDSLAADRVLRHASLVGPDDTPVAGDVTFDAGLIHCLKTTGEAAALSTQVDLDEQTLAEFVSPADPESAALRPLGSLTLQTCLLPERTRPYLLSLELARHRLMLILNKLEEWQLVDLSPEHEVLRLFDAARQAFTASLVAQRREEHDSGVGFGIESHRLALRALWLAVECSERLTLMNVERDFPARVDGRAYAAVAGEEASARIPAPVSNPNRPGVALPTRPALGVTVSPRAFSEPLQQLVSAAAEFLTVPMRWTDLEPTEGQYAFAGTDRWIEWAVRAARLPVVAGPVIDLRPGCTPQWLGIWENDYETLRELVYEHLKSVVTRYRRTVSRWTVVGGLHVNAHFKLSLEQMMDLTRVAVLVVRKLHPGAKVQVEIDLPWGEYFTASRRSLPPTLYAEILGQAGIQVDGVGLRVQMGGPARGKPARDLAAFSAMLDRYAHLDRPLSLTAIGAPSAALHAASDSPGLAPGWWRHPWSPAGQAEWASAFLAVALAKPYIQSVCWQELADWAGTPELPTGGLLDEAGVPKPVFGRVVELRRALATGELPVCIAAGSVLDSDQADASAPATAV